MTDTQPIRIGRQDGDVELERAELYGLLSALWLAAPDDALLREFRVAVTQAPQGGGLLESAWQDLVAAMRATDAARAAREHDALFGGAGNDVLVGRISGGKIDTDGRDFLNGGDGDTEHQ